MKQEFDRLISLGWQLPPQNDEGLYLYEVIDEKSISFPSASYDAEDVNSEASGFWAVERANAIARILKPFDVKILWEIGAGNDNKGMIREFKVMLMKFVNEGRVPRRQAHEILTDLAAQGL